jgi:hypothetical protein
MILVYCFNKGFLIVFGQLYLKQSSAFRSRCALRNSIMLIHMLRTVDQQGYYTCWTWTKTDVTFFLMKGR